MTEHIGNSVDLSISLQHRKTISDSDIKTLANSMEGTKHSSDDTQARSVAKKFEALLIHNMLKTMRKTTMSEGKSNKRAIYDDMLDEKLADTMVEAGGIGIADQLLNQIKQQQGTVIDTTQQPSSNRHLRELFSESDYSDPTSARINKEAIPATDDSISLAFAEKLWSSTEIKKLTSRQFEFVQPLIPHARRNAQKLGTSPNAILAIAALETGWGQKTIKDENGKESHNLFGIKATTSDKRYAKILTTEYIGGTSQKIEAKFKTYANVADAVNGFADFILVNPRYSKALEHADDPERFLQELQEAGYATDPRYADKAVSIMRQIERTTQAL